MKQKSYNTKQKTAIIREIKNMGDGHFTVDGLCKILVEKGETVGRTTVYRCLEKLSAEGFLRKYTAQAGESVCYQYVSEKRDCHEHFHLKCEKCGSLIHMECEQMHSFSEHIKGHHGFSVNPFKTVIYGTCEVCKAK